MTIKTSKTLRKMKPRARELARLGNDAARLSRRLHAAAEHLQELEIDNAAMQAQLFRYPPGHPYDCKGCPDCKGDAGLGAI